MSIKLIIGGNMKIVLTSIAILCLVIAGIAVYVWSGGYNVAAITPHWKVTVWFLSQVRNRSIAAHSKEIVVPSLKNPELVEIGFRNYHAMCRLCHNAPGYSRTEISKGLNPSPPDLVSEDVLKELSDAEIYWVIKNGIKMTGMPAFVPTHSEDELWGIVVFVKRLPTLKSEEYAAMVKAAGLHGEKEDDHYHRRK